MKKYLRKLIALVMSMVLCTQVFMTCASAAYTNEKSSGISDVTLSMLADMLADDPAAMNLQLSGNILTYRLNDLIDVRVIETVDDEGTYYLDITEGSIHNLISTNSDKNEVTLDGTPVEVKISESVTCVAVQPMNIGPTKWVYSGTRNVDIKSEDLIKNLAITALISLITSVLSPIAGAIVAVASRIIDHYGILNPYSYVLHTSRTTYFEENYRAYQLVDKFYGNEERTDFIDSITTEHWE